MREKNFLQTTEKWLKTSLKRKVSFSQGTVVAFLITGLFGIGMDAFAGFNNAALPIWIDSSTIPGNWVFTNIEPEKAKTIMGDNNIVLGRNAGGNISGTQNFIAGHYGAGEGTQGTNNIIMGQEAGKNVSGNNNVALGDRAGKDVSGNNNFAAGPYAAGTGVTGYFNIAIGNGSGQNVGYKGNVVGLESSNNETGMGRNNIAIGRVAGNDVQGNENIAIGARVGQGVGSTATTNSQGIWNVAIGTDTGNRVQGTGNTALGSNHTGDDTTGSYNFIGGNGSGQKVSGNNNIILGEGAGTEVKGNNTVAIGKNAGDEVAEDETISIGTDAKAAKAGTTAIGKGAKVEVEKGLALGAGAISNVENSIALGDDSKTIATGDTTKATTKDYVSAENIITGKTLNFAGGDSVIGVVSVGGNLKDGKIETRRIQNVAPGLISKDSTDAVNGSQLYAVAQNIAASTASPIKYFSVKQTTDVANHKNDGASAEGAIAVGPNASAGVINGVAIGNGASINYEGTAGAGGIAIGKNAQSHQMSSANHETIITFGRDKAAMAGGIAIGQDTHSRITNVELGNRDYRGVIGDFDLNGKTNWDITSGIGTTAVGDNSYAMGNFQSINGSFNLISKAEDKSTASWAGNVLVRGQNALHNAGAAIQGFGATISGALNTIEAKENLTASLSSVIGGTPKDPVSGLMYSGLASAIVGTANRVNKSNGALIFGTGNEITNSYLSPNAPIIMDSLSTSVPIVGELKLNPTIKTGSIKELSDTLRKYAQDNRLGSVGVIGGANTVDHAIFSNVIGVGNKLTGTNTALSTANSKLATATGTKTIFSIFNSINGYENKAANVKYAMVNGANNDLSFARESIVSGNNNVLKGTEKDLAIGNIVLGFNTEEDPNAIAASIDDSIAIGNDTKLGANNAIAIGVLAQALGEQSISIGTGNIVKGANSGALGDPSIVAGAGSYTLGNDNAVGSTSTGVSAIGNNNQIGATATYGTEGKLDSTKPLTETATVENSKAVGNNNYINTSNTYVLGSGIGVKADKTIMDTVENSVYLGNDSQVAKGTAIGTKNLNIDGIEGTTTTGGATGEVKEATITTKVDGKNVELLKYTGFAGEKSFGAVAVGSAGAERRIQNVAAGEISSTSTDAINGSQLYRSVERISFMPAYFYNSSNGKEGATTYTTNATAISEMPISKLKIDFGYGLKAEEVTDSKNDKVVLVSLDKETIKNDPDFKGPKGEQGNPGIKGDTGAAGSKGDKGDTGVTGGKGEQGIPGVAGKDGINGVDGKSPTAIVVDNGDGTHTFTVKNTDGKETKTIIKDGVNGQGGVAGEMKYAGDNNSDKPETQKLNTELKIVSGDVMDGNTRYSGSNVVTKYEQQNGNGTLIVSLKESPSFKEVMVGDTTISSNGVAIKDGASITKSGIDAGGEKITNVKAGTEDSDAVNVKQLREATGDVHNINNRIDQLEDKTNKGLANAAAMAGIEFMDIGVNQATVAAAVGGYEGTQAVAVGLQGAPTENTRVHAKMAVTPGANVKTMYSVGAAYRFNIR